MAIEPNNTVVRTAGIMTAPVDQEIVLLNMARNNYVSLDNIGRRIWELLEYPVSVANLCRQLGQEFEGTEQQITTDVLQFLTQLETDGLVHVAE
ncbi:MAG: PqqD family protein [Geobacter sp.]|nr:MAG: PqqD family protein [Geobacter sp.]